MQDINTIIENLGDRFVAVPMKADFKAALKEEYGVSATYALLSRKRIKQALENDYEECEGLTLIDNLEIAETFNENHLFHEWDSLVDMGEVLNTLKGDFLSVRFEN